MTYEALTDIQAFSNWGAILLEDVLPSAVQLNEITAHKALLVAIRSLPKKQREVLSAYILQERTEEGIAKEQEYHSRHLYAA